MVGVFFGYRIPGKLFWLSNRVNCGFPSCEKSPFCSPLLQNDTFLCHRFTRFVVKYSLMSKDNLIVPIMEEENQGGSAGESEAWPPHQQSILNNWNLNTHTQKQTSCCPPPPPFPFPLPSSTKTNNPEDLPCKYLTLAFQHKNQTSWTSPSFASFHPISTSVVIFTLSLLVKLLCRWRCFFTPPPDDDDSNTTPHTQSWLWAVLFSVLADRSGSFFFLFMFVNRHVKQMWIKMASQNEGIMF